MESQEDIDNSGVLRLRIVRGKGFGYGYSVKGSRVDGGPVRCINGHFYAPLPVVTKVMVASCAQLAGLCAGDLLLDINGNNVEGVNHTKVVEMLKSCEVEMTLTIVRPWVDNEEGQNEKARMSGSLHSEEITCYSDNINNNKNNNNNNNKNTKNNNSNNNKSIQKYTPKAVEKYVIIPGYMKISNYRESYVAYHIYIDNNYVCSRRFNDFKILEECLKENFKHHKLPPMPGRRLFSLSDRQIEDRMTRLETYIQTVCSMDDIYNYYVIKEFLQPFDENSDEENGHNKPISRLDNYVTYNNVYSPKDKHNYNDHSFENNHTKNHTNNCTDQSSNTTQSYHNNNYYKNQNHTINNTNINNNLNTNNNINPTNSTTHNKKTIKILFPDRSLLLMDVNPLADVSLIHHMIVDHLDLNTAVLCYFALFQVMPDKFERKLTNHDKPFLIFKQGEEEFKRNKTCNNNPIDEIHTKLKNGLKINENNTITNNNYIKNNNTEDVNNNTHIDSKNLTYKTTTATTATTTATKTHQQFYNTNLVFKKWIFSKKIEAKLCKDPKVMTIVFEHITNPDLGEREDEVVNLIESDQKEEAIKIVREIDPTYNTITFPHCSSDSRKHGHVILSLSCDSFTLHACTTNGIKEGNAIELNWKQVTSFNVRKYKNENDEDEEDNNNIKHNNVNDNNDNDDKDDYRDNNFPKVNNKTNGGGTNETNNMLSEFSFTIEKDDKPLKTVVLSSVYSEFMAECCQKILHECC